MFLSINSKILDMNSLRFIKPIALEPFFSHEDSKSLEI